MFLNPGAGGTNAWLKLKLVGTKSNRAALGAHLAVHLNTPGGARTVFKTVNSGGSFGANPLRQEIGLGNAVAIERVEVFWPTTGQRQVFTGLELNALYQLTEGMALAERRELRPIRFDLTPRHRDHAAPGAQMASP